MPWIEPNPEPCQHPNRPKPSRTDRGRVWECAICNERWRVVVEDMGHDVMPGELPYQVGWTAA